MRAFILSVAGAAVAAAAQGIAFADGPPKLDVTSSCNAAARGEVAADRGSEACFNDERTAQEALAKDWSGFSPSIRAQCLGMNRTGGPPSYVELFVCLEVMRDAAKIE